MRVRNLGYWILALAAVGGLVVVLLTLPVSQWVLRIVEWSRAAGALGIAVFSAAYVLWAVLFLPASVLTAGAGFVYGPLWATLLVSPVSVLAATVAFLLGRTVAREWVARRVSRSPRFRAVDQAIGTSGFKIVLLLRMSPLFPYNLLNYALGLTRIRLRDYVLGSFVGMLPGTLLYAYIGSLVTTASQLVSGKPFGNEPLGQAFYWIGLVATLLVTVLITRNARKELARIIESEAGVTDPAPGRAR